jgi:hypothetical protein
MVFSKLYRKWRVDGSGVYAFQALDCYYATSTDATTDVSTRRSMSLGE